MLPLGRERFTPLTLSLDRREGGYGSAALGGLINRGIDLAEPPVEVSNGMGLDVDPGGKGGLLGFHGRLCGPTFPHMGGDKLSVMIRSRSISNASLSTSIRRREQASRGSAQRFNVMRGTTIDSRESVH
jgi:hypothetical protein